MRDQRFAPADRLTVTPFQQRQPDRLTGVAFQNIFYQQHIAQGLGHFLLFDLHKTVMHPIAAVEFAVVRAGALGDFILGAEL